MKSIAVKPRLSEKTYAMSQASNTYVFQVPNDANKHTVEHAVVAQFKVTVTEVRMASAPAKSKRVYRKRTRNTVKSTRSGFKKAYVTLKEGDKLPIFADVNNEEATKSSKETK